MNPERWRQIDDLLQDALARASGERPAFLATACAGDEALRLEVESLLVSHERAGKLLDTPLSQIAAELLVMDQALLTEGQIIGSYRIAALLGTGGMGEVYLAEDARLGRPVALKFLSTRFTQDKDRLHRFEREARAASGLNHPNILTIYEIGQTDDHHYIATEFIDGETLRQHMAGRALKIDGALDIAAQVASALAAAHEAGIIHRDIKPENIMLRRRDGIVKVLDFGLAKLAWQQAGGVDTKAPPRVAVVRTNPGIVMGTVQYMSPEQARGLEVDARSDIWSLGVVLYELVTGAVPFAGETPTEVIARVIEREAVSLTHHAPEVPAELQRIINKTLVKDREERYQTVKDLLLDLKALRQELEFERKLESAVAPERRISNSGQVAPAETTSGQVRNEAVRESAARTMEVSNAHPTSSAEYLVTEIKHHKLGAMLTAVAAVIIAVAAVAYFFNPARGGEAIDSVAVLPFVNAGGDPNAEYLSDGISDGVINSLSRLPKLRVISLNAVLRYKGKQIEPQVVGRELNVRAVLIGKLTQRGDGLAISTELVDVRDNRRLWGGQYNRKLADILGVQEEIAREITEGLRLRLSGEEKKQLVKQHTENNDAYLHYSLGNYYFRQNTKEGFEKSIESFEQAVKIDPNYALAYAELARTYQFMISRGFLRSKESEQKVEWAALKALQLDDTLAEAHASLGVHKFINFDWVGAEQEIKRALELDPNSSQANGAYATYLRAVGRADEGLPYEIRARELDSSPDRGEGAFAYFMARQYDKAIELYRKGLEKKPDNAQAQILLGEAYVAKGMPAEGVAEMQKGVALDATLAKTPERWDRYPLLAYAYAAAGRRDEALKILDEQQRLAQQRYVSPYNFAIIYTGLGDKDRAFEWLTKCVEQRTLIIFHLKSRPLFDPLRADPRYRDLLWRMNLAP